MYVAWMLVFENPFNGEFFIRTLFQLTSCLSFMQTVYLYFKLLKNTTIKTFSPQFLLHHFFIKYKTLFGHYANWETSVSNSSFCFIIKSFLFQIKSPP